MPEGVEGCDAAGNGIWDSVLKQELLAASAVDSKAGATAKAVSVQSGGQATLGGGDYGANELGSGVGQTAHALPKLGFLRDASLQEGLLELFSG